MPRRTSLIICVFPSLDSPRGVSANHRQFKDFCACPFVAPESPLIVCGFAGHTTGTVQTWKDTEPDARRSTEEILGFCFKELPPLVAFWNFIFSNILIMKRIPFIVQCTRATVHFNLRASLRSRTFRRHSRVPQVRTLYWRMRGMKWQQSASSLHP